MIDIKLHYEITPIPSMRNAIGLMLLTISLISCMPLVKAPGTGMREPWLERAGFTAADGALLPVRSWLPRNGETRAAIIALHGFNDYSRAFTRPGAWLAERGIAVYAYDQRGFGLAPNRGFWAGLQGYQEDLAEFVVTVKRRHVGLPVFLLGESMGGALAIASAGADRPLPMDGLILSAPAVWSRATMPWYQRSLLALLAHTVPWLELTGEGMHIQASDNLEMLRQLGRDPWVIQATRVDAMHGLANLMDLAEARANRLRIPTLVLYGEKDEVIPRKPFLRWLDLLPPNPSRRVILYPQGYHLLLRDMGANKVWTDIAAWIEGNLGAPLVDVSTADLSCRGMAAWQEQPRPAGQALSHRPDCIHHDRDPLVSR